MHTGAVFFLTKNEPFCNLCKWYKSINERFLVHNWIILYLHDIDGHHDDAIYLTLYILWLLLVFLGVFFHFNYAESLNCWLICTFRFHWVFLHFFPPSNCNIQWMLSITSHGRMYWNGLHITCISFSEWQTAHFKSIPNNKISKVPWWM